MNNIQYFELDGVPMRRKTSSAWPEVYRSAGIWEKHSEPIRPAQTTRSQIKPSIAVIFMLQAKFKRE